MDLYTDGMRYMIQLIPITKYILHNILCVFKIFSFVFIPFDHWKMVEEGYIYSVKMVEEGKVDATKYMFSFWALIVESIDPCLSVRPSGYLVWRYFYTSSWWSLFKMLGAVTNTRKNQFLNFSISFVSDVFKNIICWLWHLVNWL